MKKKRMSPRKTTLNTEERESDFVRLLRGVQANRVPVEELLEHEIFKNRLRLITMAHARTKWDAEDLACDVQLKVFQNLRHFKPDQIKPYGGFFHWLQAVTRNTFLDTKRRSKLEFDERRVEDIDIADPNTDIESSVLYKEVLAELEKSINALPLDQQLFIAYYVEGFSFREISYKMRRAGFPSSHTAVAKSIKNGLTAFFTESDKIQNITSKNAKITKVRVTRAKREFHTIVEQAITSGTDVAITSEGSYITPKTSKTTQPNSRPGWQSASDLLRSMQSPESKQGIQDAFDASPEALGQAAVEHATKGRTVPVSSLTTFLMAASTVNVVGRVMNLTKDAA
jgi:RNA polymerase sigma factor (sigma-70 family)